MRNKCKHKSAVKLIESPYAFGLKWMWCSFCGATRLDKLGLWSIFNDKITWKNGKWKSPSVVTER